MAEKFDFENLINIIILAVILIFLLYHLKPELILNTKTPTGGDYGSHLNAAYYAKEHLWDGKLIGLYPDWMAGLPIFQFYFVLPYALIALLSYVLPFVVAFKIISLLGIFLLPICIFFMMKLLDFKFPAPIIAAIFSLFVLFDGTYSVWGGNIKSTLAGQFAYSLSFALLFLFIGFIYKGSKEKRFFAINAILFSFVILSHLYTSVIAAITVSILALIYLVRKDLQRFLYLIKISLLTFLLTAFWTLPFLFKLPFSSAPTDVWYGSKIFSLIFRLEFIPFYILVVFIVCFFIYTSFPLIFGKHSKEEKKILSHGEEYSAFFFMFMLLLFIFAFTALVSSTKLLNIRFIPFINMMIFAVSAIAIAKLVSFIKGKEVVPLILLIVACIIVIPSGIEITSWSHWNFDGIEGKSDYQTFKELNEYLKNDTNNGRIQFEYGDYNSMGSPRVFETSPLYHGKPVIEALFLESSLTFPYHYYMEKEISSESWWPGFKINVPEINLTKGIKDLRVYNIKRFVVSSQKIKEKIRDNPDLDLEIMKTIGNFNIYSINEDSEYVELLEKEPILILAEDWKNYSFDWFDKDRKDVYYVYSDSLTEQDKKRFRLVFDEKSVSEEERNETLDRLREDSQDIPDDCQLSYSIEKETTIKINTDCIGKPVLVKYSFFPNWQVEGASKVYLASPNLMMILPEKEQVVLSYKSLPVDVAGACLSLIGFIILIYLIIDRKSVV